MIMALVMAFMAATPPIRRSLYPQVGAAPDVQDPNHDLMTARPRGAPQLQ
jgi:hypothetical protein